MSDRIVGMASEEANIVITSDRNMSYGKSSRTGSGNNKLISTHWPHDNFETNKKNETIQINHDQYNKHIKVATRGITGTSMEMPCKRC